MSKNLTSYFFYFRQNDLIQKLKFENLEELMNDFRISLPEDAKISADIVMNSLDTPGMKSSSNVFVM